MKTAMIWGASGGIGRALVRLLVAEGWRVLAVARQPEGLEE
ncbi:MAG: SDR family NAD(P)-dependent oxidoreductase, partial [Anaerolineae bacterium]|nr:SDR family NAD(P)-dependent oxidoreductase [Anaerolineae bacterium]